MFIYRTFIAVWTLWNHFLSERDFNNKLCCVRESKMKDKTKGFLFNALIKFFFINLFRVWFAFHYLVSFQEIVPLNAGNVLVLEDNEPAAKWLALINHSLNGPSHLSSKGLKHTASFGGSLFFQKPTYRKLKKTLRTVDRKRLKGCNCVLEMERKASKDFCFLCQESNVNLDDSSSEDDDDSSQNSISLASKNMKYSLVASKQMVGIFVCVWMKKELVQHVGHLRVCCISRGIMGCLGNKVL